MVNNIFIIYDKAQEQCANILLHLFSNNPDIKASIYTQKEAPKLVSREKVIFIGEGCSSVLNSFEDLYYETGIHIGIMGSKAWICCEGYDWDEDSFISFDSKLGSYCSCCQMEPKYTEYKKKPRFIIFRDFFWGKEHWKGDYLRLLIDDDLNGKENVKDIIRDYEDALDYVYDSPFSDFSFLIDSLNISSEKEIRKWQYLLGTLMFYKDYLDKFIEIDHNHETDQESVPNEKKK